MQIRTLRVNSKGIAAKVQNSQFTAAHRLNSSKLKEVELIAISNISLVKIFTRSRRDLVEISARIAARSRRVFGRRDFLISPRSRHRAKITAEIAA